MDKIEVGNKLVGVHLSGKTIIDNSVFNNLDIADKGEATTQLMKLGGDIEFRESFSKLTNYQEIAQRLKAGDDVSFELQFNGIVLPSNFTTARDEYFAALKPIEEMLNKLIPPYPFAERPVGIPNSMTLGEKHIIKGGYQLSIASAQKIWQKAGPYWVGNTKRPGEFYVQNNGGRYAAFYKDRIEIGCQTVQRWEVEEAAQHYGWTFPKVLGK